MTNQEFLSYCYKNILRREPDSAGLAFYSHALESGTHSRESLLMQFINSDEYIEQRESEARASHTSERFPPGHFYSPIPSEQDRAEALARPLSLEALPGIDLSVPEQMKLIESLRPMMVDCTLPETRSPDSRYFFLNGSYSFSDGLILQAMMRMIRPQRIIEIGSGYSSALMLDVSDQHFGGAIDFTFIEPYADLLRSLMKEKDHKHILIEQRLQELDLAIFSKLQANDILFVDSTHVSKLGSDVNRIIFEILPLLNKGVYVHIHDIFWPFEYPEPWIREGRAWNEAYMLRAFLEFNSAYEVVYFSDQMLKAKTSWFESNLPVVFRNSGGNIWIRRKA